MSANQAQSNAKSAVVAEDFSGYQRDWFVSAQALTPIWLLIQPQGIHTSASSMGHYSMTKFHQVSVGFGYASLLALPIAVGAGMYYGDMARAAIFSTVTLLGGLGLMAYHESKGSQ